jgi:hypothetical protein
MRATLRHIVWLVCFAVVPAFAAGPSPQKPAQSTAPPAAAPAKARPVNVTEEPIVVTNGVVAYAAESIDQLLAREQVNPTPTSGQTLEPGHLPGYEAEKAQLTAAPDVTAAGQPPTLRSEVAGISFDGPAICGCEPPDPILCVGPNHILMGINDQIRAANKADGSNVWSVSWEGFFASVKPSGASFTSDPKVFYDPGSQRYFALVLYVNGTVTKSWWMLAVSTSSQITSSTVWHKWALDPTIADPGLFADYPGFGFDGDAIYVTSNMFSASFAHVDMAVIPKAQLLITTPSPTFTQLTGITTATGSNAFTIQPAQTYGTGQAFFASTTGSSGSAVYLYRVVNPLGAPSLTKKSVTVTSYSSPPNAPQSGGGTIDTLDSRMLNVVWQNDRLWCTHPTNASSRAAARWYEFDTTAWPSTPSIVQTGTVTDATFHYAMPSIAVDQADDAAMGFTRTNSSTFPSAAHTSRSVGDAPGTMATPVLDHAGTAHYSGTRWGDFSGTVIDPTSGVMFWTLQEYSKSTGDGWGTWVASFSLTADTIPPTPDPMTFEILPEGVSPTSVYMRATLATDATSPPVQYDFDLVTSGTTTGWMLVRDFTQGGLTPDTTFTYRVKARDSAPVPNETAWSNPASAYTLANVPAAPLLSGATANALTLDVQPNGNPAPTEFAILCAATTDAAWNGMFADALGNPSATAVWQTDAAWGVLTLDGLAGATQYCFQVKARNGDLFETAFSPQSCAWTAGASLRGDLNCDGSVNFGDINPFVLRLSNPAAYQTQFPNCPDGNGDINADGSVNFADINPFVTLLSGG